MVVCGNFAIVGVWKNEMIASDVSSRIVRSVLKSLTTHPIFTHHPGSRTAHHDAVTRTRAPLVSWMEHCLRNVARPVPKTDL